MILNTDKAVAKGIRRTINRFRENPFYYFTESDIHASLYRDILYGNSDKFYLPSTMDKIRLSIVHLEYPTNFKFSRKEINSEGDVLTDGIKKTRGNFDLVILKEELLRDIANTNRNNLIEFLKFIISKNIAKHEHIYKLLGYQEGELIDYAIEVKFFHFSNTTQNMFEEVKIDNLKLEQSIDLKANIKPVNLIFCYYWSDGNKNKKCECRLENFRKNLKFGKIGIEHDPQNLIPEKVLNIFIEANINQDAVKETQRPVCYFNCGKEKLPEWVKSLTSGYDNYPK